MLHAYNIEEVHCPYLSWLKAIDDAQTIRQCQPYYIG